MDYEYYFQRVQDCRKFNDTQYSQLISPSVANKKDLNLYRDCFSNHTDFVAPNTTELIFDSDSSSRYLQRDNLSAFFVNNIYAPPSIFDYESKREIRYVEFIADFAESSFYSSHEKGFKLGSNRIRYVVGDVGQGKSAFMKRVYCDLYRQMDELDSNYKVISVYMNLEKIYNYGEKPIPLKDDFESHLFKRIMECMAEAGKSAIVESLERISTQNDARLALKYLISRAKEEKVRFLIYIDNLDFYHYYYARYCFFEEGNKQQEGSVIENINWLISNISDPEALGHLGLNIIIAVRSYVYDEIVTSRQGIKTETDSSQAICLDKVPDNLVVSSRVELFAQAAELVLKKKPKANLQEILQFFKIKLTGERIKGTKKHDAPLTQKMQLATLGNKESSSFVLESIG